MAYGRQKGAYNKTGAEIPVALLNEYSSRSNTAVTGLANIFSAVSYNQLENLYKSNINYSNISEAIGSVQPGYLYDEHMLNDVVSTGGAGGLNIMMNRKTGYTKVTFGPAGTDYWSPAYTAAQSVFHSVCFDKVSDLAPPTFIDNKILDSPLLFNNWVNRNTLVAKPAEPLLRANRIEVYPAGGVAANVVALTTDTLSNLIVSNVNSYMFTVGPN
jgi:hypothetical protein